MFTEPLLGYLKAHFKTISYWKKQQQNSWRRNNDDTEVLHSIQITIDINFASHESMNEWFATPQAILHSFGSSQPLKLRLNCSCYCELSGAFAWPWFYTEHEAIQEQPVGMFKWNLCALDARQSWQNYWCSICFRSLRLNAFFGHSFYYDTCNMGKCDFNHIVMFITCIYFICIVISFFTYLWSGYTAVHREINTVVDPFWHISPVSLSVHEFFFFTKSTPFYSE